MTTVFKIAATIVLVYLLTGCGEAPKQVLVKPTKKLVVLAYDISMSNDDYAILKKEHFKELFSKISLNGGGKFYGLLIKANSKKQDVFEYTVPAFDTLALTGNMYQVNNIKERNKEILAPFNSKQSDFVTKAMNAIVKPKTENFTDLSNTMQLAEGILLQTIYADRDKYLIIISDGINDLPPRNGEDDIKTTHLDNVTVILVRPTRNKYVTGKALITTASIQDAIINI